MATEYTQNKATYAYNIVSSSLYVCILLIYVHIWMNYTHARRMPHPYWNKKPVVENINGVSKWNAIIVYDMKIKWTKICYYVYALFEYEM